MITKKLMEAPDGRGWVFLGILAAAAILVPCLNLLLPPSSLLESPQEAGENYFEHLLNNVEFSGEKVVGASLGTESAYDGPFYRTKCDCLRI